MSRLLCLIACLVVLLAPAAAVAQTGNPLSPVSPATATPTPAAPVEDDLVADTSDDVGRGTLYLIGGAILLVLAFTGIWITRDARRTLPEGHRPDDKLRDEGPHKLPREAKAKRRAQGKAAKQARRRNR